MSGKKLKRWTENNENLKKKDINVEGVNLKKIKALNEHRNELKDLLKIIQYVITNSINNSEFRTFMIKRFLHNYIPQGKKYNKCLCLLIY